tara:strand:- start:113 stop:319 length:207 start_codon:yes stop_codon:yes gene_type:complete
MKVRGNLLRGEARFVGASTSKERVKQYRLRQKELGRLKREMYLTDTEFASLKDKLNKLRFKKESPNDK